MCTGQMISLGLLLHKFRWLTLPFLVGKALVKKIHLYLNRGRSEHTWTKTIIAKTISPWRLAWICLICSSFVVIAWPQSMQRKTAWKLTCEINRSQPKNEGSHLIQHSQILILLLPLFQDSWKLHCQGDAYTTTFTKNWLRRIDFALSLFVYYFLLKHCPSWMSQ